MTRGVYVISDTGKVGSAYYLLPKCFTFDISKAFEESDEYRYHYRKRVPLHGRATEEVYVLVWTDMNEADVTDVIIEAHGCRSTAETIAAERGYTVVPVRGI